MNMDEWKLLEMVDECAEKRGVRLMAMQGLTHPNESHLRYVLCHNKKKKEYIVWTYNVEFNSFFSGSYFEYDSILFEMTQDEARNMAIKYYTSKNKS